ncbi:hypothetical protein [Streptomyces lomondensis]|uniref:Secreted protein n=1 Tax=Streptomyces lomondensis TaxID=68229 RepID=A0ABQ2XFF6_9ACTN|nr:hypothetical protein [Streptomyces lomondensis]MCF0077548.1 hypothetical protein [Streptomyces lomondensis]GGX14379.1 hypothetical protein GCM10010383_50650 [Streptomyces lomondensis]
MRRTALAPLALAAVLFGTQPASAATAGGWEPAPSAPWDVGAGARCGFPVHGEPVVDEVVRRVLSTHADGSARRVAYKGDLVVRVTNTESGASYDADASGSAVVEYGRDGSQTWAVRGPVLVGVGPGQGSLPRGLYLVDGVFTMHISPTGYKEVRLLHGTTDDLCDRVDPAATR